MLSAATATRRMDMRGYAVAPGFIEELIEVCRRSGAAGEIAHIKCHGNAYPSGSRLMLLAGQIALENDRPAARGLGRVLHRGDG